MATRSSTAGSSRRRAKLWALPGTQRRQASRAALAALMASRNATSAADSTSQKRRRPTAMTACRGQEDQHATGVSGFAGVCRSWAVSRLLWAACGL